MSIAEILTPEYFREIYLQGIKTSLSACGLAPSSGAWSLPDSVITHHIATSIASVARELDIDLRSHPRRVFTERYDQQDWHHQQWYLKRTKVRPVKRVYSIAVQRGTYSGDSTDGFSEIPVEWVNIASPEQGSIFILPYTGAPAGIAHLPWGSMLDTWFRWMPLFVRMTLSTGFEFELVGTVVSTAGTREATISGTGCDNLQNVLQYGMRVKLGSQIVTVDEIPTSGTFTFSPPLAEDFSGTAVVLDYDPAVVDAVAYSALGPILETVASKLYGTTIGSSTSIDTMAQSKTTARTPQSSALYSQQLRAQERYDKLMVGLAATYRPFNAFSF